VEKEHFDEIIKRLDLIVRLLALNLVKDENNLPSKVEVLDAFGFQPKEIAGLLKKNPNHIRQVLHRLRKKKQESPENGEETSEQRG
jgi:ParB-like chromosome segregation protein Spo0J